MNMHKKEEENKSEENKPKTNVMSSVGIIKKIDDLPELKEILIEIFETKTHVAISNYSIKYAYHILEITGLEEFDLFEECIEINRLWQQKKVNFQAARQVAFKANRAAKEEKNPLKVKLLRVLGQVAATPHVRRHSLIASDYGITLINLMYPKDMKAVENERLYQIQLMKEVE